VNQCIKQALNTGKVRLLKFQLYQHNLLKPGKLRLGLSNV
jgi:hypothetical protein